MIAESKSFKEDMDENKPRIIKSIAYVYRSHNRLEEARSWFLRIITADRYSDEAKKAAIEIIGTYQITGDWENIRQEANRYLKYMVKEGEENSQFAKDLRRYGAESDWMLAQTKQQEAIIFEEKQQTQEAAQAYEEAGKRFEAFYRNFVESEDRASALEQAAISYEKSGQTEYAAKLFQEYIENYPSSESAPIYMEQIAKSYLSILEYTKSLEYYQLLYDRTRRDPKRIKFTKTALLNMAASVAAPRAAWRPAKLDPAPQRDIHTACSRRCITGSGNGVPWRTFQGVMISSEPPEAFWPSPDGTGFHSPGSIGD